MMALARETNIDTEHEYAISGSPSARICVTRFLEHEAAAFMGQPDARQ